MARVFDVEVTIPEGINPATNEPFKGGDSFIVQIEEPTRDVKPRGQLWGIALKDMTDDQLKREIINAGSVLYKAEQRGANADVIAKNKARLDAAKAEKERRNPTPQGSVVTGAVVTPAAAPAEGTSEETKPAEGSTPVENTAAEETKPADNAAPTENSADANKPADGKKNGKGTKNSAMDNNKTDEKLAGEI